MDDIKYTYIIVQGLQPAALPQSLYNFGWDDQIKNK